MLARLRAWWSAFKLFWECVWLFMRLPDAEQERELSILKERAAARRRK